MNDIRLAIRVSYLSLICIVVFSSVLPVLSGQGRPGKPAPSGAISGVVRDRATLRGVPGTTVRLAQRGQPGGTYQLSDDQGRFVFTGLSQGSYLVMASKAGFTDGSYGQAVIGSGGSSLILSEGEWSKAADISLARLAVISGRVTDEEDEPVAGAFVRLLNKLTLSGLEHWVAGPVTTTDDRGEYRFSDVLPGNYVVSVPSVQQYFPSNANLSAIEGVSVDRLAALDSNAARTGGERSRRVASIAVEGSTVRVMGNYPTPSPSSTRVRLVYAPTFGNSQPQIDSATVIRLGSGDELDGIDIRLHPVPSFRVSGRLKDVTNLYAGIVVRLVPAGLEELGTGSEAATALVASDGSFNFLSVPAGRYTVSAPGIISELALRSPRSAIRELSLPSTPGSGRRGASSALTAAPWVMLSTVLPQTETDAPLGFFNRTIVVDSDITDLEIPLEPAARIRCQVVLDGTSGTRPSGSIILSGTDGQTTLGIHSRTLSSTGPSDVVFAPLLPGSYDLFTTFGGLTVKTIDFDGRPASTTPLQIRSGQEAQVTITLTAKTTVLAGRVVGENGSPVPLPAIMVFPTNRAQWKGYGVSPTWIRASLGGSDGSFTMSSIRAGEYFVAAVDRSKLTEWANIEFLAKAAESATRITLAWGETRNLDLSLIRSR